MGGWLWVDSDYGWLAFFVLTGLGAAARRRDRARLREHPGARAG